MTYTQVHVWGWLKIEARRAGGWGQRGGGMKEHGGGGNVCVHRCDVRVGTYAHVYVFEGGGWREVGGGVSFTFRDKQ